MSKNVWFWPLAVAALIIAASSRSVVAGPNITNIDKMAHFGVYGLLGTLLCRVPFRRYPALWALLAASAFGVTDEWHQSFVPGRSPDVRDWIADTLGAALAVGLYHGWSGYRRLLERPLLARRDRAQKQPQPREARAP